jgi:hypothetical protein
MEIQIWEQWSDANLSSERWFRQESAPKMQHLGKRFCEKESLRVKSDSFHLWWERESFGRGKRCCIWTTNRILPYWGTDLEIRSENARTMLRETRRRIEDVC